MHIEWQPFRKFWWERLHEAAFARRTRDGNGTVAATKTGSRDTVLCVAGSNFEA